MHRTSCSPPPAAIWWVVAALGALGASGCCGSLAEVMVSAPNRLNPFVTETNPLPPVESLAGVDQQFQMRVGPPEASLSVSVIEPAASAQPPKGTILVLHGIHARSFWMLPQAEALAEAGYRAVLVDLRGHGRSTGEYLTFGLREARDLSQVIDVLQGRGLVAGQIGVYGVSYGATTSIHLAGRDPRVRAVVAVAPFSTMRDEVPQYGRTMVPGVGEMISDEAYQHAIDAAGGLARFDPDRANAIEAIQRTTAQVLLIHGTNDWVVPQEHSIRLHEAARDHSQVVSVPWHGHVAVWLDPTGEIAVRARAWFDRWLGAFPDYDRWSPGPPEG
jgi:pimeloyl-ACP methyl ester carboxylesterase